MQRTLRGASRQESGGWAAVSEGGIVSKALRIGGVLFLLGVALGSALALAGESKCYCVSGPDSASVCLGTTVSFSVAASGEGTLIYQWYHGSTPLSNGARTSGATSDQLQISDVDVSDAGEYSVTVSGTSGSVTSDPAMLTVKAPTVIGGQPERASVCPGSNVSFSVAASGEGTLTYKWYRGSTPLSNGGRISGATSAQLQIGDVEAADAGEYSVTVTAECGPVSSSAATLTVKTPTAVTDPKSVSSCPGTAVSFSVTANGEGTLTYQWYHGSTPLSDGGSVSGATSAQLQISAIESSDSGSYTVTVTGACDAATSRAATLTVKAPTAITAQPEAVSVYSGDTASFSVTASGEGTLTYQWSHGSTPLSDGDRVSGATGAQLQITEAEEGNAGDYTVVVTGECDAVTSSVAPLEVRPPMGAIEVVLEKELPEEVLLILDLSSSMDEEVVGGTKIAVAKDALRRLLVALPGDTSVGLRTFHNCGRSDLEAPIEPVSAGSILAALEALTTFGTTPLAYTLRQIPGDLQGLSGPFMILFITDGMETCKGDPVPAASELAASGFDIIFRLFGFDIARVGAAARDQLQAMAAAAGGLYTEVANGDELLSMALGLLLPPTYRVYDSGGTLIKEGIVGDGPFEVLSATYTIEVGTDPQQLFEGVEVGLDRTMTVTVPSD